MTTFLFSEFVKASHQWIFEENNQQFHSEFKELLIAVQYSIVQDELQLNVLQQENPDVTKP